MNKRSQVLEAIEKLDSLPMSSTQLVRLLGNPEADIDEVTRCVERDPAIAANVLRVCNSALYAGKASVGSVHDAIVRLGTHLVMQLALTQGLKPIVSGALPGYQLAPGSFWRYSVAVATCSEILARMLSIKAPAETFTAGLLHDIGKLVLGLSVQEDLGEIADLVQSQHLTFEEAERRVVGIDHAEAGALLLEYWGLPESLCMVARCHHEPEMAPSVSQSLDLVHAADILVMGSGLGVGADGFNYRLSQAVVTRLMLNNQVSEKTVVQLLDELATLDIDATSP